jgi:hypothetical protein
MYSMTLYNTYVGRIVAFLAGVTAVAVFLYGAFLLGAVAHATSRTAAEREVQRLSSEVSALEGVYLTETKALSPDRAAAIGFVAPSGVATVYAGEPGLTLGHGLTGEALRQ